jgi:drug/metabolite transporter (DMT)-like permease
MNRARANGLLTLAAFLWGAGNVAQKTVLDDIGPLTAVGLRCLIAAVALAPFFARFDNSPKKGKFRSAAMVIASFAVAVTLYQMAAGLTTVTNAGFLVNISIAVTPLVGWLLLRQRPCVVVWPAAFLTLTGAYVMSGGMHFQFGLGDTLAIAAAVCFSFWMIFLGQFVNRFGQAGLISLAQFTITGCVCLCIGLIIEPLSMTGLQSALPELLMLGLVSTGAGYLLQAIAQAHTSASEAAVIVSGEAIFGAIFAFMLLGEMLDARGLFGALLIVSGICLIQFNPSYKPTSLRAEGGNYETFS